MRDYRPQLRQLFKKLKKEYKCLKDVKLEFQIPDDEEVNNGLYQDRKITIFVTSFSYGLYWSLIILLHEVRHAIQDINYVFSTKDWIRYDQLFKFYFMIEIDADIWAISKFKEMYIDSETSKYKIKKMKDFLRIYMMSSTNTYYKSIFKETILQKN